MKTLIFCFAAVLAGCASSNPAVVTVDVPVSTPCIIQKIDTPDFAVDSLPVGSGIWAQMGALRADRLQREAYEQVLNAAIQECQK